MKFNSADAPKPIRFLRRRRFPSGRSQQVWLFRCRCGNEFEAFVPNIKSGHTQSCGCYQTQRRSEAHTTHGGYKNNDPLITVWRSMRQRCLDPKATSFEWYGAKGVQIRWNSFEEFRRDMAPGFKKGLTIDRVDSNGDYCKENCRWATPAQQNRNYSRNVLMTLNGKTQCRQDWAEELGIQANTLYARRKLGWSDEKSLTTPIRK